MEKGVIEEVMKSLEPFAKAGGGIGTVWADEFPVDSTRMGAVTCQLNVGHFRAARAAMERLRDCVAVLSTLKPEGEQISGEAVERDKLLRHFVSMFKSGAQGCDMDWEGAQALALAVDAVFATPTQAEAREAGIRAAIECLRWIKDHPQESTAAVWDRAEIGLRALLTEGEPDHG